MNRPRLIFALTGLLVFFISAPAPAQSYNVPLIPRSQAELHGLTRAWFTQVPLDRAKSKITSITLHSGLVLVVTDEAMLHVIDLQTGLVIWSYQTGDRRFLTLAAGANATQVAVVNGSMLSVLDRTSGAIMFRHELTNVPERGAILSEKYVAIPMVLGPLEVYPLDVAAEKILYPQYMECPGRVVGMPLAVDNSFTWATDRSHLRYHQYADPVVDFSVRVPGGTSTGVSLLGQSLYVGTESGYVFAYENRHGTELWEFATGSPIRRKPIAVDDAVYVVPVDGGMYSLHPDTGLQRWYSPDPERFMAATPNRVYSLDKFGWLLMNDTKTGVRLDAMQIPLDLKPMTNDQNDRLLLYTDTGLIQCLHEVGRDQPLIYSAPKPPTKPAPPGAAKPGTEALPPAGAAAGA